MLDDVCKFDHSYFLYKPASSLSVFPKQIVLSTSFDVITGVGKGFIVTRAVAVFWQPFPSIPVTVYVCVANGAKTVLSVIPPSQM